MIVTIAFCAKDTDITIRLARWIAELGGVKNHDCLLGYHADTVPEEVAVILEPHFRHIGAFKIMEEATAYPEIANMMWKACVHKIADEFNEPWFWMEPDAVPLVPDWLDRIEAEYKAAGKPFMLDKVVTPTSSHNSGTGVYPGRVRDYTMRLWQLAGIPWDVFFKDDFTPLTHHTALIHDKFYRVWDDPNSGEPTFPDAASLSIIESGAVLFHRNKGGSLIQRLREKKGGAVLSIAGVSSSQMDGKACFECGELCTEEARLVGSDLMQRCLKCGSDRKVGSITTHDTSPSEDGQKPASIADGIRFHCAELASLVQDKTGRRVQLHAELRKHGLIAKAKVRK